MRAAVTAAVAAVAAVAAIMAPTADAFMPQIGSRSPSSRSSRSPAMRAQQQQQQEPGQLSAPLLLLGRLATAAATLTLPFLGGLSALTPPPAHADGATTRFVLPPVDEKDKSRCQFKSSAMGQANAARDKLYDLRLCDMSGKQAQGFDLSGAIMAEAKFQKVNFKEAVMSKAYAKASDFSGADFSNAVVDRVSFDGSNLKGAVFANAVLSSSSFTNADLQDADFTDAYMGEFDLKALCRNPTLQGTNPITGSPTKESAGCK